MKVSVLMNVYNGGSYVEEAINSVLSQSYDELELIFWDNMSTDATQEIANSFDDRRLRYLRADQHTNLGRARQLASANITGDALCVLDADDLMKEHSLRYRVLALEEASPKVGFVYGNAERKLWNGTGWDDGGLYTGPKFPTGRVFHQLLRHNFICFPALLVRRTAFEISGGFVGRYQIGEDYSLTLRLSRSSEVCYVDRVVAEYRVHESNESQRIPLRGWREDMDIYLRFLPDPVALMVLMRGVWRLGLYYAGESSRRR